MIKVGDKVYTNQSMSLRCLRRKQEAKMWEYVAYIAIIVAVIFIISYFASRDNPTW